VINILPQGMNTAASNVKPDSGEGAGAPWLWATLLLSSVTLVAVVFAFWELVENRFFRDLDYVSLHYLYISRGIASSLLLAAWAAWFVLRQRRAVEAELRRSRERYLGLLNATPSVVLLFDHELIVYEWNAAAERLYGISREETVGTRAGTVPADRLEELRTFMREVAAGRPVLARETYRVNRAGEHIAVLLSLLPFREHSNLYYMEVASDIRDQVRLRQSLIELEKLTSMGQMAAGTAHHLNTPLASMLLRVQMMRDRMDEGNELAADLDRLEQTVRFCQQFVRRLLDFSRRPALVREPEQLGPVIEGVMSLLSPSFAAKQLEVSFSEGTGQTSRVAADKNQLEMLLLILISNAVDATEACGHIAVNVEPKPEGSIALHVQDDGCGIAPADQPHVFEPFFTTKPPGQGTGLGLAIAKSIVSEHGGDIQITSERGQGTRVTVLLPTLEAA